jgi:hypothetical protein
MKLDLDSANQLTKLIRWYDVLIVGLVFLIVVFVFVATERTGSIDPVNALGVALLICGGIYLFIGLVEDTLIQLRAGSEEGD